MIRLWTDGAYTPRRQHLAGWAFVAEQDGAILYEACSRVEGERSGNRMELHAVIEALRWAKHDHPARRHEVVTDSRYVTGVMRRWLFVWKCDGWKRTGAAGSPNPAGVPIANLDLWQDLDVILGTDVRPDFRWVRGHNGDHFNERADYLARQAARQGMMLRQPGGRPK